MSLLAQQQPQHTQGKSVSENTDRLIENYTQNDREKTEETRESI